MIFTVAVTCIQQQRLTLHWAGPATVGGNGMNIGGIGRTGRAEGEKNGIQKLVVTCELDDVGLYEDCTLVQCSIPLDTF